MTITIAEGDIQMQTLNRAAGVAIVLFFTGLGLMIGWRIDQVTIALLAGVTIALVVVIPITALIIVLIQRDRSSAYSYHQATPPTVPYPSSPQHVIAPPTPKAYLPSQAPDAYAEPFAMSPRRRFYIIGEDGTSREILPDNTDSL
jgi:hypothetical protein